MKEKYKNLVAGLIVLAVFSFFAVVWPKLLFIIPARWFGLFGVILVLIWFAYVVFKIKEWLDGKK